MPLKEQDRQKLDGIVSKMQSNGEKTEDIQFVVNDFKSKYEQPTTSPTTIAEMRRREEQPKDPLNRTPTAVYVSG